MGAIEAIELEVVKASLSGIVQEMQNSLFRTGFSTIVRESQDASCALMNAKGNVVAQHVVLPLHIGAFPACTAAVIDVFGDSIAQGDAFIINHPYQGGSPHAPDIAVITPVFVGGELFGFCGSIAHKSDIGGPVPGSCSGQAREVFNEGLHLPAVRYQIRHEPNLDIERLIAANIYVSTGLLNAYTIDAREGSVLNLRFPAPVNTYNPTVHALVDAVYAALSNIVPDKMRADGSGSRSIILGGRS